MENKYLLFTSITFSQRVNHPLSSGLLYLYLGAPGERASSLNWNLTKKNLRWLQLLMHYILKTFNIQQFLSSALSFSYFKTTWKFHLQHVCIHIYSYINSQTCSYTKTYIYSAYTFIYHISTYMPVSTSPYIYVTISMYMSKYIQLYM